MTEATEPQQIESVVVEGITLDLDDFTFREMRELRRVIKEHILESDEDVNVEDLAPAEFLPAAIYVLKKRDDPSYTIEQALDLKFRDVIKSDTNGNGNGRPTKPAKGPAEKRKPSARG